MLNKFNIERDIVSSFRLDIETNQVFMTVGNKVQHLEIPLPISCTEEFIELNKLLEEQKIKLQEAIATTQMMMSTHRFCKSIQALETIPRGTK